VSTKGEPIAPTADLLAQSYDLPPVGAGDSAALDRRSHAGVTVIVTTVVAAAIVAAAVAAEAAAVFGFFIVIVVIVIL
jgi:hypothetical protein